MKGMPARGEFLDVLQHRLAAVRRDDAECRFGDVAHVVLERAHHRARMERGDLVVVEIGRDERLRGVEIGELLDAVEADAAAREVLAVRREILADGRHRQRIGAEQLEVVGDIAGAAAELAAHARHEERHVQDVHLVRQDVVLELVLEHHDGVVGQRAADEGRHRSFREKVSRRAGGARLSQIRRAKAHGRRRSSDTSFRRPIPSLGESRNHFDFGVA